MSGSLNFARGESSPHESAVLLRVQLSQKTGDLGAEIG